MKLLKQTLLGRFIPSILLSLSATGCTSINPSQEAVIDSVTDVMIYTRCGTVKAKAKIDTGADGSSIDTEFAEKFCIDEPYIADTTNEKCPNGQVSVRDECRKRVQFRFEIAGVEISDRASLSDRSDKRYPVLIGNRSTEGRFAVRPIYETTHENWEIEEYELEEEEEN